MKNYIDVNKILALDVEPSSEIFIFIFILQS